MLRWGRDAAVGGDDARIERLEQAVPVTSRHWICRFCSVVLDLAYRSVGKVAHDRMVYSLPFAADRRDHSGRSVFVANRGARGPGLAREAVHRLGHRVAVRLCG